MLDSNLISKLRELIKSELGETNHEQQFHSGSRFYSETRLLQLVSKNNEPTTELVVRAALIQLGGLDYWYKYEKDWD